MPFTPDEVAELEKRFADIVAEGGSQTETTAAIIVATVEASMAHMEKLARFPYRGVWTATETYKQHDWVTFRGSMWVCREDNEGSPPPGAQWQLAVKREAPGERP